MEPSAVNRLRKSSQISRMCHNFRSTQGQNVQLMWSRPPKEAPTMGVSACSVSILLLHTYQMKAEVNSTGFSLGCPSSSLSHAGAPYLLKSPSTLSPFTLTALSAKLPTLWDFFFSLHCNWNDFIQHRSDQVILSLSNSSKWLPLPSENVGIP